MPWPLSQDFNEAVQNPSSAFTDPDLKGGVVTTTPLGVPLPRSGNYADVYQIVAKDGKAWAVKCFTRAVAADMNARYTAIASHLGAANLPFTVGFEYLADGIRVKGKQFPILKMQWVEGLPLNTFVKDNLNRATVLESMLSLWVRLCRRLRETGMAHCDLQHGNVILVPGEAGKHNLSLKLVDYDGMFVPALAGRNPGEAGHASFQHPQRITSGEYSADLDRFPHLVVATALRGLLVGGKTLWEKYDTGDNLLFNAKDFANPAQSKAMRELWDSGDPFTIGLLAHLVISASKPLGATPWLDTLMPEGRPPMLTPSQERQAMQLLGLPVAGAVPAEPPLAPTQSGWQTTPVTTGSRPAPAFVAAPPLVLQDEDEEDLDSLSSRRIHRQQGSNNGMLMIIAGVVALAGIAIGVFAFGGKKKESNDAQANNNTTNAENNKNEKIDKAPVDPVPVKKPPVEKPPAVKPPVENPPVEEPPKTVEKPKKPKPPKPMATPMENIAKGELKWLLEPGTEKSDFRGLSFSHDGAKLLVPSEGQIRVLDAANGKELARFTEHETKVMPAVAPLPGNKALFAGTEPKLLVYDTSSGKPVSAVIARLPGVPEVLHTDSKGRLMLMVVGRKASVIDLNNNATLVPLDLAGSGLKGAAAAHLAPDGSEVLALTGDGKLSTITVATGAVKTAPAAPANAAIIVAWHPGKNLCVIRNRLPDGKFDFALNLVNSATGEVVKVLEDYSGHAAFTPDGAYLVAPTDDAVVYLDTATGTAKAKIAVDTAERAMDLAAAPNGQAVIVTGNRTIAMVAGPGSTSVAIAPMPKPMETPLTTPMTVPMTTPMETPVKARKPVPGEAALRKTEADLRELYKEDYAKKSPADRKRLADKLLKSAGETTNDDTGRYWLLREVQAIAAELGELTLGLKALESLETDYDIDGLGQRLAYLDKAGGGNTRSGVVREILDYCSNLVEELAEKGEFEKAAKVSALALNVLARHNMQPIGRDLEARSAQLKKLKEGFEPVKAALETLAKTPDDPAANLLAGKYRCFVQGRWADGLPMLVKSGEKPLADAATLDLTADAPDNAIKKADAWAAWAETQQDAEKAAAIGRARHYYSKFITSGGGGIDKARAEKALSFSLGSTDYRPGYVMEWIPAGGKNFGVKKKSKLAYSSAVAAEEFPDVPGNLVNVKIVGFLNPTQAGRYKFVVEGRSQISIKVTPNADQKILFDIRDPDSTTKRETYTVLPAKPVSVTIELFMYTKGGNAYPANSFTLKWQRPGAKDLEPVPPEAWYHNKSVEVTITEK